MLPKIKEIMNDPSKRKKEAASARNIAYALLDEDLKILGMNGEISEDVVVNIADKKKMSINIVKKRASALGIKIIPKVDFQITYDKYYKNKPQNADEFESVVVYLKPFNKDNLYDFLNPGTMQNVDKLPCDKLKQLAQEKKKNEFYKNDTASSSGKKVCEACELAFKDESRKTIYDDYLAWCKRRSILDHAKEISKVADGNLSYEQGNFYIGQLTELFKDRKLAENIFIAFCKVEKIAYNPELYNPDSQKRRRSEKETNKEKAREEAEKKKAREEQERLHKQKEEAENKEREKQERSRKQKEEAKNKEREEQERSRKQKEEAEQAENKEREEQERLRGQKDKPGNIEGHDVLKKLAIGAIICLLTLGGIALMSGNNESQSEVSAPYQTVGERGYSTNSNINGSEQPVHPVADFWSDITSGEAPLKVQFFDESTDSPTSWNWDFGDGVTSTKQNPIHTYTTDGTYTVKETITNEIGGDTETKESYITVTAPAEALTAVAPVPDFSASVTSGEAPLTVSFTDESSGSPTEWQWNFGDSYDIFTEHNPTHTYTKAGTYTVTETVTNEIGGDTETKESYITVTAPAEALTAVVPVPDFSASVTSGEAPLTVSFTDESSGSPTEWQWNFGDSYDIFTEHNPTHTYTKAGTYTVTETVTNEAGQDMETKTDYITVTAPAETPTVVVPVPDFSASVTSGEAPLTVSFTDESSGSPTEWQWNFGDSYDIFTEHNPTHTYTKAGTYTVTETVTNEAGQDMETKTDYITVTAPESDDTTSDNKETDSGTDTTSGDTSLPTESEVLTFVNNYQGVSDFIETVSGDSESSNPTWKWDIWQDQYGDRLISFYYYQNNPKGYDSTYFDSEGNIISTKDLELTLLNSYKGA
ncbi:cell surface protein [Methanosarcina vacuolata Z-761]|uniref:Cell surface protein n=2 Tax=Methanosarcina vacuolata TaxID=2215 RepID=A0A0E3Q6E8_9EURY|nr:cell surface protein [Methanosarcina vacuolata Z-761]